VADLEEVEMTNNNKSLSGKEAVQNSGSPLFDLTSMKRCNRLTVIFHL
jgi:hypothetical protein